MQFLCLSEITKIYYFSFMHNNAQNSTQVSENNKISGTSISIMYYTLIISVARFTFPATNTRREITVIPVYELVSQASNHISIDCEVQCHFINCLGNKGLLLEAGLVGSFCLLHFLI